MVRSRGNERLWDLVEDTWLSLDEASLRQSFARHLEYSVANTRWLATDFDAYKSAALTVRDRLVERWNATQRAYHEANARRVYYLSMEFLLGRALGNTLLNLGITGAMGDALGAVGESLEDLADVEPDAGLGNGGLGRLAACYLDSMATTQLPAHGYGIRYEYGIFRQDVRDGQQVEMADPWLRFGYPWELPRPTRRFPVGFYGTVAVEPGEDGRPRTAWRPGELVHAAAYDLPVPGYRNETVNTLRLWSAAPHEEFDLADFQRGDYIGAMEEKVRSATLSNVLYPRDDIPPGRELRLKQEYFFVSASLQDILRRHKAGNPSVANLADKAVIQLNDTHPALAIPELMRILMDEEGLGWDEAWSITSRVCAYTNHTILPEALETWRVELFGRLLPRHLAIVYEINARFLDEVRRAFPGDDARARRLSIIQEVPVRAVRMAHLAIVGSRATNGVSELHANILRDALFADFHALWPDRFRCVTNGITPRRWLALSNPGLSRLVTERIGEGWETDLDRLAKLAPAADDAAFRERWRAARRANKERFGGWVKDRLGVALDPDSLFDVQAKRIHEYKRQLLNLLHVLTLYERLRADPGGDTPSRTALFAGKAAPSYAAAKLTIRLAHAVGRLVDGDASVRDRLRVVFLPDYGVTLAQRLIPATDLSEQISTAGMEASGTGNMKFALNGAVTIGTLDGANVEMNERLGPDDIFLFGMTAPEVTARRASGYDPRAVVAADAELAAALDRLARPGLVPGEPDAFRPLLATLLDRGDPWFVLADYRSYVDAQDRVAAAWRDPDGWTGRSIRNTAAMGFFSSDRAIGEYARDIWQVTPVAPSREPRTEIGG